MMADFFFCSHYNRVLGSYNDGYTQALFYALGQALLGIGIVLCRPICNKIGKGKAMVGGIALCIFNFRISLLGYQAPTETFIPVQNAAVQNFIIFCAIGVQAAAYPVIALLQLMSIKKN